MSIETELRELGKHYSRERERIVNEWKSNNPNFKGFMANAILKAATIGSAHCMGLDECDVIDEGKTADLIVIDMHRPNMQPINNITKNIVYSGSKENVKMTMINGKILYENGEFINTDIERIYSEAQAVIDRIK